MNFVIDPGFFFGANILFLLSYPTTLGNCLLYQIQASLQAHFAKILTILGPERNLFLCDLAIPNYQKIGDIL